MRRHFFVLLILSAPLLAYELRLLYIGGGVEEDNLYVRVRIKEPIPDNLLKYLKEGVKFSVNYHIEMKKRRFFFDETISRIYINKIIYFDLWDEKYIVKESRKDEDTIYKNIQEALGDIEGRTRVMVVPYSLIEPKSKYYFKTRLTIQFLDVYPNFTLFFNFIAALQYKIRWLTSDTYSGEELLSK